ncbi:hypothetical protein PMAYCL1PPCAC_19660, partial [Pristionchus mayeri]
QMRQMIFVLLLMSLFTYKMAMDQDAFDEIQTCENLKDTYVSSIGLSDKNVALLKPSNVTEMNQMLRLMIKNQSSLREVCELSVMPILCRRIFKWPLKNLKITFAKYVDSCDPDMQRGVSSRNFFQGMGRTLHNMLDHLKKLRDNSIVSVTAQIDY